MQDTYNFFCEFYLALDYFDGAQHQGNFYSNIVYPIVVYIYIIGVNFQILFKDQYYVNKIYILIYVVYV